MVHVVEENWFDQDTASGRAMLDGMARVMVRLRMLYGARTAIESGLGQPGAELP